MRLMVGPAGSGKTSYVLDQLRQALRAADYGVRLLAPTATLAQHLANQMAREGFLLRRGLIQTLASFADPWAGDLPQVPQAGLYLIVEEAVQRVSRPEFARVTRLAGFCPALARTLEEFSAAGCTSQRLKAALPGAALSGTPLGAAFLAVYEEVERILARRGLAPRAARLERAAARIEAEGLGGIRTVWLDGFHSLPDPELRLIGALARQADVTLTLGDGDLSEDLRARLQPLELVVERAERSRPEAVRVVVRAPGVEREAEEIARRILEQAAAGRPFREMGIIVRSAETYVPLLTATLERFGIPARFYFDQRLDEHPVVRFLAGAVEAMLGGWDHAATLGVLRLAPRFANSGGMDRLAFKVAGQIPNAGLGALKELAGESHAEKAIPLLEQLSELEEWRSFALAPKDWAARLADLRRLFRPSVQPVAGQPGHELALQWRSQAAALEAFVEALEEAAAALDPREMPIEKFWPVVRSALRLKVLRLKDARRNVVHVLSAPEARQWVLPVVFVCGMTEKHFPQFHRQDPFFPDAARSRLNRAGIRVRTAAEFEREEHALFDAAISRATLLVTLSYPEFDQRGERSLRSLYLENWVQPAEPSRAVRPEPRWPLTPGPEGAPAIRAPGLLESLRRNTGRLSPTALESYLQCAFQFFGRQTLRMRPAPPRPEDRLDFLRQGMIVHEVLRTWYAEPQDIAALFEQVFERVLEEKNIPRGYHTERLRNAMLDDLQRFAADTEWPRAEFESRMEQEFVFPLADGLEIAGRIDRLDVARDGRAYVMDYKYSNAENTKSRTQDSLLLQAPLYMMAAEWVFGAPAAGMFYIGLRGEVKYAGWSDSGVIASQPLPENWLAEATEKALRAVAEIRGGRIEAAPADASKCRFCDCRDVCRVEMAQAEAGAEGV